MKKIGIVTDSSTGLSIAEIKKYSDLLVIPLEIINEEQAYEDNNIDISNQQIYEAMIKKNKFLKTSQTNQAKLKIYWTKALKEYDEILFLPIADAASGQYKSALAVLQQEKEFENRVVIYETGAASLPLKAMALIALKLAKTNYSIKKIIEALNEFRKTYECFLTPDNLLFLARGGRIPNSLAKIANFLRLKAIIECKNKIKKQQVKRTMNFAIKEMLELIICRTKNVFEQTLYVINGWCKQELLDKAIEKARELGFKKIKIEPLCNILQSHTGANTIGFSVVPNKWNVEV